MFRRSLFLSSVLFLLSFFVQLYGQSGLVAKANENSNFENLEAKIARQTSDTLKLQIVLQSLQKAKKIKDTLAMADAYYFLSKLSSEYRVYYSDSLIGITKYKRYSRYQASAYLLNGNREYEKGNYQSALELYLIASKYAKQNKNEHLYYKSKFNIGLLKNTAGEREEAQTFFIDYLNFIDKNPEFKNIKAYNKLLFALADSYVYSKRLDLAKVYINKGIDQTLETDDMLVYSSFVMYSGIHHYFSENYNVAIDSLNRGKELIQKSNQIKTRTAICDYYIARSYHDLGEVETSVHYFKNVDTVLTKTGDVIPELMDAYDYLINYYKSKGNSQQQIKYINTLLKLDSIKHSNQLYLTKNISERYDTAELISEKEELINQLEREKFLKENTITILILFLSIIGILAGYGFRKSYTNKKRFEALLEKQKNKEKNVSEFNLEATKTHNKDEIDIPEDVIESVLNKLYIFENSYKFSKKHYNLNLLAKELNTNSAYLSKIINVYKHINFANYLNNLRVDFAVSKLTTNKSLRSYTIKAIAEEVGFKNAQSFSSAFHKRTGIYPSYFIKQLNS